MAELTTLQKSMAKIYANLILHSRRTMAEVPEALREEVQKFLKGTTEGGQDSGLDI